MSSTACLFVLFNDAVYGAANALTILARDTSIQFSSSETARSILEGNAVQGDDGDYLAYEASGVGGRLEPEAAATVPAVRARGDVSLLHGGARSAAARVKVSGCFGLFNTLGGRIDGVHPIFHPKACSPSVQINLYNCINVFYGYVAAALLITLGDVSSTMWLVSSATASCTATSASVTPASAVASAAFYVHFPRQ